MHPLWRNRWTWSFALCRKEVVPDKPAIIQILCQWLALFTDSQACMILTGKMICVLNVANFRIFREFSFRIMRHWLLLCDACKVSLYVMFYFCFRFAMNSRVVGKNHREKLLEALGHIRAWLASSRRWQVPMAGGWKTNVSLCLLHSVSLSVFCPFSSILYLLIFPLFLFYTLILFLYVSVVSISWCFIFLGFLWLCFLNLIECVSLHLSHFCTVSHPHMYH